jgi:hypothetical protein
MNIFRTWNLWRPQKRFPIWLKVAAVLVSLMVVLVLGLFWSKSRIALHEFSSDRSTRQFILGNDVLEIPLNMIRFENQRSQSVFQQADLVMDWPGGDGFTPTNKASFLDPEKAGDLIFMTLTKRELPMPMSQRLKPIYSKLFDGGAHPGPSGLILQSLKAGSGYDGEELAISSNSGPVWVARCQKTGNGADPTCFRDLFVGSGLGLRYRFSRSLLPQWYKIEQLVLTRMQEIVVANY